MLITETLLSCIFGVKYRAVMFRVLGRSCDIVVLGTPLPKRTKHQQRTVNNIAVQERDSEEQALTFLKVYQFDSVR